MNVKPSTAYVGATWGVFAIGVLSYLMGLWDAKTMELNEQGYYFTVLMFGLYSAISLQKTVRDLAEDIPTSKLYYIISWIAFGMAVALLVIGLYNNPDLSLSEKGFYLMAYTMSIFASITIQKNVRDLVNFESDTLEYDNLIDASIEKPSQINHAQDTQKVPSSISERIENQ